MLSPAPEAYGGRVLAIVADANKRLAIFGIVMPLILASNDGEWRAIASGISAGLALYGDVVPSQGAMRMSFNDGFLSREPKYAERKKKVSRALHNDEVKNAIPAGNECGGSLDAVS